MDCCHRIHGEYESKMQPSRKSQFDFRSVAVAATLLCSMRVRGGPGTGGPLQFPTGFNPFLSLGLPRSGAPPPSGRLKHAFRKAAVRWHPDRCREKPKKACESKMQEVNLAREVLSDPRKLQMWESWRFAQEEAAQSARRSASAKQGPRQHRPGPHERRWQQSGQHERRPGRDKERWQRPHSGHRTRQPPPPRPQPTPPAPPAPPSMGPWREVSRQRVDSVRGAEVESITRERSILGTPMVQVEVLERICYAAQKQCQKKVLERRRRRREEHEDTCESAGNCRQSTRSYDVQQGHCQMSTSEEVMPAGPPPQGQSFFRDVQTTEGCQAKCDANPQCITFQVQDRVACWLYRFRPRQTESRHVERGWTCGMLSPA